MATVPIGGLTLNSFVTFRLPLEARTDSDKVSGFLYVGIAYELVAPGDEDAYRNYFTSAQFLPPERRRRSTVGACATTRVTMPRERGNSRVLTQPLATAHRRVRGAPSAAIPVDYRQPRTRTARQHRLARQHCPGS